MEELSRKDKIAFIVAEALLNEGVKLDESSLESLTDSELDEKVARCNELLDK